MATKLNSTPQKLIFQAGNLHANGVMTAKEFNTVIKRIDKDIAMEFLIDEPVFREE